MSEYGKLSEPRAIRFERVLPGPIERVWEYLTDSDKRALWLASGKMEPRVGARVAFSYDNEKLSPDRVPPPEKHKGRGRATTHHTVLRFEPPRFLTLSWGDENNPSGVSFELTPEDDQVRLVLTHRRLPSRESMLLVSSGWHTHLAILIEQLNGQRPTAFWTRFTNLEGDYEKNIPADDADPAKR